jgi:hypothetical protein
VLGARDPHWRRHYFVRTLLTIIHAILPPSAAGDGVSQFPCLSRPDDHARSLRLELERDAAATGEVGTTTVAAGTGMETVPVSMAGIGNDEEEEDRDAGRRGREVAASNPSAAGSRGRVTRVMDTGCFVRLEGVPGGREGLVHVSQMASKRVANVKEGGEAGQEVFVKVVSVRS